MRYKNKYKGKTYYNKRPIVQDIFGFVGMVILFYMIMLLGKGLGY
jgi:hypothetical protein